MKLSERKTKKKKTTNTYLMETTPSFNLHRDAARNRYRCRIVIRLPLCPQATTFKFIWLLFHIIIINPTVPHVTYLVIFVPSHVRYVYDISTKRQREREREKESTVKHVERIVSGKCNMNIVEPHSVEWIVIKTHAVDRDTVFYHFGCNCEIYIHTNNRNTSRNKLPATASEPNRFFPRPVKNLKFRAVFSLEIASW